MPLVRQQVNSPKASEGIEGRRILLLQGPVGPFFRILQKTLEERGAIVTRVHFNAGDVLFGPENAVRFSGSIEEWSTWVRDYIASDCPDEIILFGAKRPAHRIARDIADQEDVQVLSLEEGYLRSGYVTCEEGGNNDLSPIRGEVPVEGEAIEAPASAQIRPSFRIMSWWGFLYFTTRIFLSPKSDEPLIHRPLRGPLTEAWFWLRNIWRLTSTKWTEANLRKRLTSGMEGNYFLVPLQMPSDSQMGAAARGWNIERLVDSTIRSFAKTRSVSKMVFKLHPLDGHARTREKRVREIAAAHGVSDDVLVLHSGSIAQLTIASQGMILINSTSGMTAIHHGTPLLVMGEAVYRNPKLVHCGDDEDDIEAFMRDRHVPAQDFRRAYERFLAREALVPGDYYSIEGMRIAAREMVMKIADLPRVRERRALSDRVASPSA